MVVDAAGVVGSLAFCAVASAVVLFDVEKTPHATFLLGLFLLCPGVKRQDVLHLNLVLRHNLLVAKNVLPQLLDGLLLGFILVDGCG